MKAREYVDQFESIREECKREFGDQDLDDTGLDIAATIDICLRLIGEIHEISKSRRSTSAGTLVSIVEEQERKWLAIQRKLNRPHVREGLFSDILTKELPEYVELKKEMGGYEGQRKT